MSRNHRSTQNGIPKSIWIIGGLITVFLIWRFFSSSGNSVESTDYLNIEGGTGSSISLYMTNTSKKAIDGTTKLYSKDSKISVSDGEAMVSTPEGIMLGYLHTRGELAYKGKLSGVTTIQHINGNFWFEAKESSELILKNMTITPDLLSTLITVQNDRLSTLYVLKGKVKAKVGASTVNIIAGNKITILNSEAKTPNLNLNEKIEIIDDTVRSDPLFSKHDGAKLLDEITSMPTKNVLSQSGRSLTESGTVINTRSNGIQITSPEDESTTTQASFSVLGTFQNKEIARITINNKDASINQTESTFEYKAFRSEGEITDIIYKGYDKNGVLLEKGSITIYSGKNQQNEVQKPTVTSYPINDKQFKIIAPTENPHKTTESIVRIQGVVPVDIVKYITINDFRLTKFKQFSTDWYYFANKDYATMNEGINLYTIRYYDSEDKLLSERLFTIVKERKE